MLFSQFLECKLQTHTHVIIVNLNYKIFSPQMKEFRFHAIVRYGDLNLKSI